MDSDKLTELQDYYNPFGLINALSKHDLNIFMGFHHKIKGYIK